jgi:phospholipid/cholesterol/gamma-HCH transport system substrate-binding protein
MKDSVESKIGIFFAVAVHGTLLILESLGGFGFLKRGYHLNALFKNVQELKVGDFVKMAGVQVGRVESVSLTDSVVRVTMNLDRDVEVRTDSKASIHFTGLMGNNFVSLDFGTPAGLKAADGAYLQTIEQPDLGTLMTKLDNVAGGIENLTKSFSGEKIEDLIGPFTDFLKNNRANLTATIANIKTTTDRIAQGKGTVGKLINDDSLYIQAQTTVSNLQDKLADIQQITDDAHAVLTNANAIVSQVNAGKGTLGKLVKDDTLYMETTGTMTNLHQIMLKINHGQGSVGKLINDDSLLKNVTLSLQKIDKATESLEDTGPLSVLGTMASSLF